MNWWWVVAPAAAVLLLLLARYVAGIVRLRKGLRRVAHGDLERPLSLDLPCGLRAAQRDLEAIARQARDLDRAAHRERAELTAVLASIPEGIFTVDRRLCVLQANRGVETMFQLSASPVGRTVVEAFGHAAMHKLVQEGVAERKPHRGEIVVEQGGTRRVFELSISPLELGTPEPGAAVVVHNITRIKSLEQVRREFVANVSHELRTPLTIISGYLETLTDGGLDDRSMTESALGVMSKHADRLGRLVDDLLTISRAESRSVSLEIQRLDLRELLRHVVEQLDEPIRSQAATVRITTSGGDLSLDADAARLEQVFLNLLENALKYGNRPGLTVDLYAERTESVATHALLYWNGTLLEGNEWDNSLQDGGTWTISQRLSFETSATLDVRAWWSYDGYHETYAGSHTYLVDTMPPEGNEVDISLSTAAHRFAPSLSISTS